MHLSDVTNLASRYPGTAIHARDGGLRQFGAWHIGTDEALLPFTQADLDTWQNEPSRAELVAAQLFALWAQTELPPPADWAAARNALRGWRQAAPPEHQIDRLETATELLSVRVELIEAGGTWSQVLTIAKEG